MKVAELVPGQVLRLINPSDFWMGIYRSKAWQNSPMGLADLVPVPARLAELLQLDAIPPDRMLVYIGKRLVRLDEGGTRLVREVLVDGNVYRVPGRSFRRPEPVPEFIGDGE